MEERERKNTEREWEKKKEEGDYRSERKRKRKLCFVFPLLFSKAVRVSFQGCVGRSCCRSLTELKGL